MVADSIMERLAGPFAQISASASQGSSSGPGSGHSNVYIRGLPLQVNETLLTSLFQQFGSVQSIRIFRSNQNPAKAPFAFVKLKSEEEAEASISSLNGFTLGGSVIEVRLADKDAGAATSQRRPPPSDNIYCKNLPAGFGDNELRQLFSPYGTVTMCRVLHQGDATGHGGASLVRLSSMDDAIRAVQALQGHRVQGALHPLIIRFADSAEIKAKKQAKSIPPLVAAGPQSVELTSRTGQPSGPGPPRTSSRQNPYSSIPSSSAPPSFAPLTSMGAPGGLGGVSAPLQPYYGVSSVASPSIIGMGLGPSPGMGHSIPGQQPGIPGLPGMGGMTSSASMGGMPLSPLDPYMSNPDYSLHRAPHNLSALPGTPSTVGVSAMAVASLYVKNMPPLADKLFLYEKFAPFGAILSVKILTNEDGASRGVGFVNFSDTSCAAKAAAALHNLPVGEHRNLHVTFQTHHKS